MTTRKYKLVLNADYAAQALIDPDEDPRVGMMTVSLLRKDPRSDEAFGAVRTEINRMERNFGSFPFAAFLPKIGYSTENGRQMPCWLEPARGAVAKGGIEADPESVAISRVEWDLTPKDGIDPAHLEGQIWIRTRDPGDAAVRACGLVREYAQSGAWC